MAEFSVLIPTHNRAPMLAATLESVFRQRFTDYEVVVADDGSTDDTPRVIAQFGDRVKLVAQPQRGPGAARNLAAAHARGRYLAFLDSDDVWYPWTLSTYAEAIHRHDEPAFLAGRPRVFQSIEELASDREAPLASQAFPDYFASGDEWRWWGASSFVIRADAFAASGGFTSEWINGEDADLALRLGDARGFVHITAPVTFGYREHAASATGHSGRTLAGVRHAVRSEQQQRYPGGPSRALERRRIVTRHARPVVLGCVAAAQWRDAWQLYRATFGWNLRAGHWRFLAAFPVLLMAALLKRAVRPA